MAVCLHMALLLVLSLIRRTGFELFDINVEQFSLNVARLGVHFGLTLSRLCYEVLLF